MNNSDKSKEKRIKELEKLQNTYESRIKNLEKELNLCKNAEKILYDMISKNPISVQIIDKDGYTISVNDAHSKFFGAIPPKDYSVFKDSQLKEQGLGESFEKLKKGEAVFFPDTSYNAHLVNPNFPDNTVWIKTLAFPIFDGHGNPERFIIMHENITDRKHAEEEMKELNDQLHLLAEKIKLSIEKEKKSISQELHDTVLQDLAIYCLRIDAVRIKIESEELKHELLEIATELRKLLDILRNLTTTLRPEIVKIHGIEAAVKIHAESFAEKYHMEIITDIDRNLHLSDEMSFQLFRILQEALNNIAKHAEATKVEISLKKTEDGIYFKILDNGKGFNYKKPVSKQSFGLLIMKDRVISMGGSFDIKSRKTKGTAIEIVLPLAQKNR